MSEKFDPKKHLIQLKGKYYLETKFRILWYRQDHPNGAIQTEVISYEPVLIKATIYSEDGAVLATAHAGAVDKGNAVWSGKSIEKGETAAIGRALGNAGYGTQFVGVEDAGLKQDRNGNWHDPQREQSEGNDRRTPPAKTAQNGNAPATAQPPTEKLWKDTYKDFVADWVAKGITQDALLTILGVERFGLWTKTRKDADAAVAAYLAPQQKSDAA